MFRRLVLKYIRFDEAVIHIVNVSWFHYRWALVRNSILLLTACFFFYPLQTLGVWGIRLFLVLICIALVGLVRITIIRNLNVFILTNKRIIDIDQKGIFERVVAECPLEHIQDIRYNVKGFLATLFQVGTVIVDSGSGRGRIELNDIRTPERIKDLIMNTQHHHSKKQIEEQDLTI